MTEILQQAFDMLETLPKVDRDRIAYEIIERVEDKTEWDRIISEKSSQDWLKVQAKRALKEVTKATKKLSLTFLSMPHENFQREEAYWKSFDDLPVSVQRLAEKNYRLWKENSQHPGLRFKKIHAELPIFSFRVGMQYRTVGVETDEGKMVWFWIGSFQQFQKLVNSDDK